MRASITTPWKIGGLPGFFGLITLSAPGVMIFDDQHNQIVDVHWQ
jgi:hypothetical protein